MLHARPCIMLYALCTMHYALCSMLYALRFMLYALWSVSITLYGLETFTCSWKRLFNIDLDAAKLIAQRGKKRRQKMITMQPRNGTRTSVLLQTAMPPYTEIHGSPILLLWTVILTAKVWFQSPSSRSSPIRSPCPQTTTNGVIPLVPAKTYRRGFVQGYASERMATKETSSLIQMIKRYNSSLILDTFACWRDGDP